jgi:hypothetical protein
MSPKELFRSEWRTLNSPITWKLISLVCFANLRPQSPIAIPLIARLSALYPIHFDNSRNFGRRSITLCVVDHNTNHRKFDSFVFS